MSSNVGDTVALQECDWTGAQPDIGSAPSVPSPYAGPGSEKQSVNPDGTDQDRTIIVVDDDEICRELASMFLKESGYDVLVASDGAELLQLLECTTPNLLLLDLDLPGLSGFDICQKVKADPRYADMPVIFLTGTTSPQAKERAFGVGGADYVTKPLEAVELLARIRCHLELAMNRKLLRLKANTFQAIATEQMGRLEQVRSGQASMLTNPATFSDLNLAVQFVPANEAGGDFYEIAGLGEDQFGLLVTDVAGHDLGVPFLTGALKGLGALCLGESLTACDTMIMLNSGLSRSSAQSFAVFHCEQAVYR